MVPRQDAGTGCWARGSRDSGFSQGSPLQPPASPASGLSLATQAGPRETLQRSQAMIPKASPKFPPRLLSPAETLLLFGDSPSRWEGTGLCWEVTASLGGARAGGTQLGHRRTGVAVPQPAAQPAPPPACSPLASAPLLLRTPISALGPMCWLGSALGTQASCWERGSISRDRGQARGHVLPWGSAAPPLPPQLGRGVQGCRALLAVRPGLPPGPLAPQPRAAGGVSPGIGIPGGRCEVQPGLPRSCQSSLRED